VGVLPNRCPGKPFSVSLFLDSQQSGHPVFLIQFAIILAGDAR
jgi:hypothetical protein